MWGKKGFALLLAFLLSFAPCLCFSCAQEPGTPEIIKMQKTQHERLKNIISNQKMRLEQLESKLKQLEQNSTGVSKELTELQQQLTECKSELMTTQKRLQSAEISLQKAEENLMKLNIFLEKLTERIQGMAHELKIAKRQRNLWIFISAGLGYWALR